MIGLHTVLAPILARLLRRYVSSGLDASNVRVRSLFFSRRLTLGKLTFRGKVIAEELRLPFEIDALEVDGVEVAHAPSVGSLFRSTVVGGGQKESARCALGKVTIRASGMTDEDAARRGVDVEELRRLRDARERAVEVMVDVMRERAEGELANNASASSWKEAILGAILERLRLDIGRVEVSYEYGVTMIEGGGGDGAVAVAVRASMDGIRVTTASESTEEDVAENVTEDIARETISPSPSTSSLSEDDVGSGMTPRKRARLAAEEDDLSFSGDTKKRVEIIGLALSVNDGSLPEAHVLGPYGRLRIDVRLRRRARATRRSHPDVSAYTMQVDVVDDVGVKLCASQLSMLSRVVDDLVMWSKRLEHGERRPTTNAQPIDWWRYAVRACAPRGERHRQRTLKNLRHQRAMVESYVDVLVERVRGGVARMPSHLSDFESRLSDDDVSVLDAIARSRVEREREEEGELDGMFPEYRASYTASELFDDGTQTKGFAEPRPVQTPKRRNTGSVFTKSSSYISRAYKYVMRPKEKVAKIESAADVSRGATLSLAIPAIDLQLRDRHENKLKIRVCDIIASQGLLHSDDHGVLSDAVVTVGSVFAWDFTSGDAQEAVRYNWENDEPFVTAKINPSYCHVLNVQTFSHIKISPMHLSMRASSAQLLVSFANASQTPFITALSKAATALNTSSPQCRLKVISQLGESVSAAPMVLEASSIRVNFSDEKGALLLVAGCEKFVMCVENGARTRTLDVTQLINDATTEMEHAYTLDDAWRALEKLTKSALLCRTFVSVDGAWMCAPGSASPIFSGAKLTVTNELKRFDSDLTIVNLNPLSINISYQCLAALNAMQSRFQCVIQEAAAGASTPSAVESGIRFGADLVELVVQADASRLQYKVSGIDVAMKGSSSAWKLKSTIDTISGTHSDSQHGDVNVLECSHGVPFLKTHVCSRIAGTVKMSAVNARVTKQMIKMLEKVVNASRKVEACSTEISSIPKHQLRPIQHDFDSAWECVETFEIEPSNSLFLHGSIAPLSIKLFEESVASPWDDIIMLSTQVMDMRGNAGHVEAEFQQMSLDLVSREATHSLISLRHVHAIHTFSAETMLNIEVGSSIIDVTPTETRRLAKVIDLLPHFVENGVEPGPSSGSKLPSIEFVMKETQLLVREDSDVVSLEIHDARVRAHGEGSAIVANSSIDNIRLYVNSEKVSKEAVRIVEFQSPALVVETTYAMVQSERDALEFQVQVGGGVFDLNAPGIIIGAQLAQDVRRAFTEGTPARETPLVSTASTSIPRVSGSVDTGEWNLNLPWRSEAESLAPFRVLRLKTRQSLTLNEYVQDSNANVSFALHEFILETGYYKDEDAFEDAGVMFTILDVVGLSSDVFVPLASQAYMMRPEVLKVTTSVREVHACANEIAIHLLREISELVISQPVTMEAITAYEQRPKTKYTPFDASLSVDSFTSKLEHVQINTAVPVIQAICSNIDCRVQHGSKSCVDAKMDFEIDYLHPVKTAWEPILEPILVGLHCKLSDNMSPTSISVAVSEGIEFTLSHSVYEAFLKATVVVDAAKKPISDLETVTTFGPCTYQMTNATGFDVDYTLSLVHNGTPKPAGEGSTAAGETRVMHFQRRRAVPKLEQNRVVEHGAFYWASPIAQNVDEESQKTMSEPVPHISLDMDDVAIDFGDPISLENVDEEKMHLEFDAVLEDGSHARVIAEIGPCEGIVNRYEVLLRSDVSIVNGTGSPIVLCFQKSVALPATIFGPILPGDLAWLPIPLCRARAVQWRAVTPGEDLAQIHFEDGSTWEAFEPGSPFLSPLHRSRSTAPALTKSRSSRETGFNWSTPVLFHNLISRDEAIESSLCSSVTRNGRPYTCAISVKHDAAGKNRQLALCAPLQFVNTLPHPIVVSARTHSNVSSDSQLEAQVVDPGESVLFTTPHPTWSISISAQIIGYSECEDLIVPEYTLDLKNTKARENGEIYHVNRDIYPFEGGEQASTQAVSLRFSFYIDEHTQARTLHCAVPLIVHNTTSCALVIEDMLYGSESDDTVGKRMDHVIEPPELRIDEIASPIATKLFEEDAENFETPVAASPLARLAQNQSQPTMKRIRSSSKIHTGDTPLIARQSSLRLTADAVNVVTPSTPGQRPAFGTPLQSPQADEIDEGLEKRTSILGSAAHWRRSIHRRPRMRVRLTSSGQWSDAFRIDLSGTPSEIRVPSGAGVDVCEHLFIVTSAAYSTDKLCNTVTIDIKPKFILKSSINETLLVRHGGTESTDLLPSNSSIPVRWFDRHSQLPKTLMFRPENGVYQWSKPIQLPDCSASILKMRHIGDDNQLHTKTITVSVLERDDGTINVLLSTPSGVDGVLGIHAIENHSNTTIWYHQLGAERKKTTVAPKESEERMIEDSSLPRSLIIGYGELPLGEPIPLDGSSTMSYSVVTTSRDCLRITVTRQGPMCSVIIEDALVNRPYDESDRDKLVKKEQTERPSAIDVSFKCGWVGFSVLHGHEELVYGRVSGIAAKILTDGVEFKSAVRVSNVQVDHTSAKAKRPVIVAIPERNRSSRQALELNVHGWVQKLNGLPVVRSLKVDTAPAFIDVHDELLEIVPKAIESCARHSQLLLPQTNQSANMRRGGKTKRTIEDEIISGSSIYLQELIINDIELVLSFTSVPFLPVAVRGLAGVDRAQIRLRGFHVNQTSLMAADVGLMAARHFGREGVIAAGSLWAHNSLLGDPKRLWCEINEAFAELSHGSVITAFPRLIRALIAAFAHSGETALSQARDIVENWLENLEESLANRRVALRPRRLGWSDPGPAKADDEEAGIIRRTFDNFGRALFDALEGPLSGMELYGITGFVEGALIGFLSAATRMLATTLDNAELSARRLRLFAFQRPVEGSYMRLPRPLPESYTEPVRPYHAVEALGRATLKRTRSHEKDRFVAVASLSWPSHDICILTEDRMLIIDRRGDSKPYVRVSVRFIDITGVLRDATRVSVYATRADASDAPDRLGSSSSMLSRAFTFATSALGIKSQSASRNSVQNDEPTPTTVVVRCADADSARWLASAVSPFVNANGATRQNTTS